MTLPRWLSIEPVRARAGRSFTRPRFNDIGRLHKQGSRDDCRFVRLAAEGRRLASRVGPLAPQAEYSSAMAQQLLDDTDNASAPRLVSCRAGRSPAGAGTLPGRTSGRPLRPPRRGGLVGN